MIDAPPPEQIANLILEQVCLKWLQNVEHRRSSI